MKRSVYWNSHETIPAKVIEQGKNVCQLLNASFQDVKRLFLLDYFIDAPATEGGNTDDTAALENNKKYFLTRGDIKNYNVLIDGRNSYDQPINDLRKHYHKSEKYQQGLVMIIQLVFYWIMHISKTITN